MKERFAWAWRLGMTGKWILAQREESNIRATLSSDGPLYEPIGLLFLEVGCDTLLTAA